MVFFVQGWTGIGLALIILTLAVVVALLRAAFRVDPFTSGLLVPFLFWLAFLSVVNSAIVLMN